MVGFVTTAVITDNNNNNTEQLCIKGDECKDINSFTEMGGIRYCCPVRQNGSSSISIDADMDHTKCTCAYGEQVDFEWSQKWSRLKNSMRYMFQNMWPFY
ncbi:hypothetical protein SNE40_022921 [Patella caerulea]|uniref:Uncharacterized protein n=1 Tax=Patella caerulea TaxID=87958 RepID=A0AAN8IY42_PATCE